MNHESLPLARVLGWLVAGVVLIFGVYTAVLLVTTWPISALSIDKAGTFGDSFGVLTSLFTGLAFAGLLTTIYLQRSELQLNRKELEETRKEFRLQSETFHRQRFEDAFYQMLALYKENLRELSIRPHDTDSTRIHGIDALNYLNTNFRRRGRHIISMRSLKRRRRALSTCTYLLQPFSLYMSAKHDMSKLSQTYSS